MDEVRPIGEPPRVERWMEERERDQRERPERREPPAAKRTAPEDNAGPEPGPYEGADGHLHVDIRA